MRIELLGGFAIEHDGAPVEVVGAMQRALLFRLALDPGSQLGYRALAEDIWPDDPPENVRAALQSLVSRLRSQLPPGTIESLPGGYRLAVERRDVDAVLFQDRVAAASTAQEADAPALASAALELWAGDPWTPGDGYDWFERALADDRATAVRLGGSAAPAPADAQPVIPAALTRLIGRDEELASVSGQLASARLVTILGPGGAGKTRVALETARAHRRPIVVELAPAGPDELWQAILGATVREVRVADGTAGPGARDRIVAALSGREVLLVLDNCEHLIEAAADAAFELLGALPHLRVLTTSREPLGLPGEAFVPLGPLSAAAAEELFSQRVLAARGRALGDDEADAASRIRRRLDGLPLALELAAAKARTMTLDEIAEGLDDRFALLTGGLRTVLPRHQTLRALVDWSWSLLSDGERELLGAVAIYPAGIGAQDADRAAAAHGGSRAHLDALVDKSLLQRSGGRYRALETIREYGIERLAESGRLAERRLEQAVWLGDTALERDRELRRPGSLPALAWFDAEDDNIVSALRFAIDHEHAREAVRLAAANTWYWIIRDRNEDAQTWLPAVAPLAAAGTSDEELLVRAVAVAGGAFDPPEGHEEYAARHRDELESIRTAAMSSDNELLQVIPIAIVAFVSAMETGRWPTGVVIPAEQPEGLADWSRAVLNILRAATAQNRGDVAELGAASGAALTMFERVGDVWGLAIAKQLRAEWLSLEGRLEEALQLSDESTAAIRQITSAQDLQQQQGLSVILLAKLGREGQARARAAEMLEQANESESVASVRLALYSNILLYLHLDELEPVGELLRQLDAIDEPVPAPQHQMFALEAVVRGSVATRRGELDAADHQLRRAAEHAVASHDHPIMAAVALAIGGLSLERGELAEAATALDLAVALRGAADPLDAVEARIRSALDETRPARGGAERESFDRESAAAALAQILRR